MKRLVVVAAAVLAVNLAVAGSAQAAAIIVLPSGNVALGVNDTGELNVLHLEVTPPYPSIGGAFGSVDATGLRALFANSPEGLEFTAPGCLCEGWGVAIASLGLSGYRNRFAGDANVSLLSFTSTASSAVSVVHVVDPSSGSPVLEVTHSYTPSSSPYLYRADVTIKNLTAGSLGSGPTDLRYRRVMDWDMEPTPFDEFVTLQGWPAANLFRTSNDGFQSADPLSDIGGFGGCPTNANFVKCGPDDHGALFDFAFPALGAGEERTFQIFYGAAPSEATAMAALATVGAEVFSFGFPNIPPIGGGPAVAIFAFAGVGGVPVGPSVPEPSTFALMGSGIVGLVAVRFHKRRRLGVPC
jgi:type IV pilus assembly protein PilY1